MSEGGWDGVGVGCERGREGVSEREESRRGEQKRERGRE